MTVSFQRIMDCMRIRNPFKNFSADEIPFEIRHDPLTGHSCRVFDLPYRPVARPDFDELVRKSREIKCPFCPDSIEKVTPLYPEDLIQGGRIRMGGAVLLPNLLPLDRYAGVCVLSQDHFVAPGGFTPEMILDGLKAGRAFIDAIAGYDPRVNFFSINWNYMPPSGSSMIHPHFQVNAGEVPTFQPRLQMEASLAYFLKNGRTFWQDYMAAEKESDERFLTEIGDTFWTMSFAPQGALPDVWCIFRDCRSLVGWKNEEMEAFCKGLLAALQYFDREDLYSFNLSVFSGRGREGHFRVNARVTPRLLLREIGNSDQTYYQVLHREPTCMRPPESVREKVLEVFQDALL